MGAFSIWHWLVVLAVIVLIFGTKKLRNMGGDLGAAIRGFKQGMKEEDADKPALSEAHEDAQPPEAVQPTTQTEAQTEEARDKTPTH